MSQLPCAHFGEYFGHVLENLASSYWHPLIGTRLPMAHAPFDPRKSPRTPRQPESATALLIKIIKDEYETRS